MRKFRKRLISILCVFLCLSIIFPINPSLASWGESAKKFAIGHKEYEIREIRLETNFDDFENSMEEKNIPAPWAVSNRKSGVNNIIGDIGPAREDISGKFVTNQKGNLILERYFNTEKNPPITGTVLLEAAVCFEDMNVDRKLFVLHNGSKFIDTIKSNKEGQLQLGAQDLFEYETGQWYHVQILLDSNADLAELFIDGESKGLFDIPTGGKIERVRFVQLGEDDVAANMYIDDIRIIELEAVAEAPAEDEENENLIFNGSFEEADFDESNQWETEQGAAGWEPWKPSGNPKFYLDEEDVYDGRYSVRIEAEEKSRGSIGSQLISVEAGKTYLVSVKMKTEDVIRARFRVASHDENEKQLAYEYIKFSKNISGTTGWQTVHIIYTPPQEAKYIKVALFMEEGTGKVWFDDVKVERWIPLTAINIESEKTIKMGESFKIIPEVEPSNGNRDFVWSSSDESIAIVTNEGIVTGIGIGEAVITVKCAYDENIKAQMTVIVKTDPAEYIPVEGIELINEKLQLKVKETENLEWLIIPNNASDQRVRFEGYDPEIIEVLADGTVIGLKTGKTELKIITEDGAHKAVCSVEVLPYEEDEFDELRIKWEQKILGTPYDENDEKIREIIAKNNALVKEKLESMNREAGRTYLWANLKSDNPGDIRSMYLNLFDMAKAYRMPGSIYYQDEELLTAIIDALDWLYENCYYPGKQAHGNWWPWEIGIPVTLNDIVVLLYDELSPVQINNYMSAIEYFQPDPRYSGANASGTTNPNLRESVGANRVDTCKVVAVRGCIVKDSEKLELSRDALSSVFEYVTEGDGIYRDGSFIQHGNIPYTGSYGNVLIGGIADLLYFFDGTEWEVTDKNVENIYKCVINSFEPLLYKGAVMDMVSGRSIARPNGDHGRGRGIINSIIKLIPSAPDEYKSNYKSLVKHMILEDDFAPYFENIGDISLYQSAKQIVEDPEVIARESYVKHVQFPHMARVVHHRPDFAFGIASHSKRVGNYESMNDENLKGWYTGDGMTYLYNNDLGHYTDYWPTVNPYRMPGTTEDTEARVDASGQRRFPGKDMSSKSWVGGASLDQLYGVWGMDFESWDKTLNAKKSWFMFDDEIVALGAAISSGKEGVSVETTIENRKLNKNEELDNITIGTAEKDIALSMGEEQQISKAVWAHLDSSIEKVDIGYYFPEATDIYALKEARQGSYKDIRSGDSADIITNNYFTMWIDHGTMPEDERYEYVLLPSKTIEETKKYAEEPDIVILANNELAQGVKENNLNIIAINFWTDSIQKVDIVSSHNKAAVMVREGEGFIDIGVADPTMENTDTIELEIDRQAYEVLNCDPRITVRQMSPTIKIEVDVADAQGQTAVVRLQTQESGGQDELPEIPGTPNIPNEPDDIQEPEEPEDEKETLTVTDYVKQFYTIVLFRKADEEGLNFFVDKLKSREMTVAQMIGYVVLESPEFMEKQVEDELFLQILYEVIFNRQADEEGMNYWLNKLEEGYSRRWVIANMLGAPTNEFDEICEKLGLIPGRIHFNSSDLPR